MSDEIEVVDHDAALLTQYKFADLPSHFSMRDGNNQITSESEACFQCMADQFLGQGKSGTLYTEGDIVVMDEVPNHQLRPLNRAAGLNWARWHSSLPVKSADIGIEDLAEAAQILAKNPKVMNLDPFKYQEALTETAVRLKHRRLGKDARNLPGLSHNFVPASGGNAPPILGAKHASMGQHGPGSTGPGGRGNVRRAGSAPAVANPLGGPPPV
jgi:hypothetical protein